MKHLFSWIAGVAMLSISFIPAFLPAPFWWKVGLTGCALLGVGAFGLHLLAQYREDKKRDEKEREREARESARDEKERKREEAQEERDRLLIHKAIEEYKLSNVATSIAQPVALPAELGMSPDDPRIYLEIERSADAMFRRTPFILQNRGKDVAHAAQIKSFKLKRKDVTFSPVEAIPAGNNKDVLPTIKSNEPMNEHDIFHWLLKDWDANGELLDEWPIPLTIEYWDFSKKKKFAVTMTLIFHAIRYLLDEKHNWPPRNYSHPLWEFRDIQFKRLE